MKYIFLTIGGSGSTFFSNSLSNYYNVDSKPDVYFVAPGEKFTSKKGKAKHQLLQRNDLLELATKGSRYGFYQRTGFVFEPQKNINDNIVKYLQELMRDNERTVIFNSIHKTRFFSRNKISNVCCLIRHPLHAYISFSKGKRHANITNQYGGMHRKESMAFYANAWNRVVEEYVELLDFNSIIIRYEHFKKDVCKMGDLKGVNELMKKWKTSKNKNILSKEELDFFKSKVYDNYKKIYDKWDI